jgi:hypothetical protein
MATTSQENDFDRVKGTMCGSCGSRMRADDAVCGVCGQAAMSPAPAPWPPFTKAPATEYTEVIGRRPAYLPQSSTVEKDVAGTLDPLFNARYGRQLLRRFALYAGVAAVFDFVTFLLDLLISLVHGAGLLTFAPVLWVLSLIVVIVVFWVLPVPALLGDWHRLVTFRAPEAASTLDYIREALDRHHTPYDRLGLKPITPPGEGRKLYLELRRGFFAGYISCFAHGDDLYIGWTFWIYVSPLRALIMRLGRKVQDYTGRGNDIYQTLRFESTQATLIAMHACAQEGIEFATGESYQPPSADVPPRAAPARVPSVR